MNFERWYIFTIILIVSTIIYLLSTIIYFIAYIIRIILYKNPLKYAKYNKDSKDARLTKDNPASLGYKLKKMYLHGISNIAYSYNAMLFKYNDYLYMINIENGLIFVDYEQFLHNPINLELLMPKLTSILGDLSELKNNTYTEHKRFRKINRLKREADINYITELLIGMNPVESVQYNIKFKKKIDRNKKIFSIIQAIFLLSSVFMISMIIFGFYNIDDYRYPSHILISRSYDYHGGIDVLKNQVYLPGSNYEDIISTYMKNSSWQQFEIDNDKYYDIVEITGTNIYDEEVSMKFSRDDMYAMFHITSISVDGTTMYSTAASSYIEKIYKDLVQ